MKTAQVIVHAFYDALARGDAKEALALLDPQVSWSEAEHSPYYQGEVRGPDAVVETVFNPINRDFENFGAVPSDFVSEGSRVAAFGRYQGRHRVTSRLLEAAFVHLWTVNAGRLVKFVQYTDVAAWEEASRPNKENAGVRPAFF